MADLAASFAKDVLTKLATKAASSAIDIYEGKISGQGAVRAVKGFKLFILNATETVKHEIKKQEGKFWMLY